MLQEPIKIYRIINKRINSDIDFFFHEAVNHSYGVSNRLRCANKLPFNKWQVGDYIGISVNETDKHFQSFSEPVFSDTRLVNRVVQATANHQGQRTIDDLIFGDGWVEEEEK